jgi:hypothetical protein
VTDHYSDAEQLLEQFRQKQAAGNVGVYTITPLELTEAQVHATLAGVDKLAELFATWRTDVESETIGPDVEHMVEEWFARPECTTCGGTGKQDTTPEPDSGDEPEPCPAGDPGCDAPADGEWHCHDACEPPKRQIVDVHLPPMPEDVTT